MLWPTTLRKLKKAYAAGRWTPELYADSEQLLHAYPNNTTLRFYLSVCHSLCGLTPERLLHLTETLPPRLTTNPGNAPLILSLVTEQSHDTHAHTSANTAEFTRKVTKYLDTARSTLSASTSKKIARLPALLADTPPERLPLGRRVTHAHHQAQSLLARTSSVAAHIRQHRLDSTGHQWAIVGNSPQAIGQQAGEIIDAHDTVVRFNHASIAPQFQIDYGSNTHLHVVSPTYRFEHSQPLTRNIAVSGVRPFHRPGLYWQQFAAQQDKQYLTFEPSVWYGLVATLEAPPSAGLLCASQLASLRSVGVKVSLFGFGQDVNANNNHYSDRHRKSERHNWAAEAQLIQALRSDPMVMG